MATLPRLPAAPAALDITAPPRRVLLVEDDEGDAFLVEELLLEADARVDLVRARSVTEATALLGRRGRPGHPQTIDCVLLDLGLPDASGLDALHRVLGAADRAAVLVLTGLTDEHRGIEAVAVGAQDYLVKGSVDGDLLFRSIRYAVERKRADEQLRRLYEAELRASENARMERGLLPTPQVDDERIAVVTSYRPGRDAVLGGDFYDVLETDDRRLHVMLGDVAGHGPDEAALGVALRIAWRTLVLAGVARDRLLPTLEAVLVRERRSEEVFATLAMLVVEPDRASGRLFLAGHPAPLLLAAGGPTQLPDDLVGPALGMVPGVVWGSLPLHLRPGWRVMLFSDGLVEGRSGRGSDRVGVEGLLEIARGHAAYDDSAALVDALVESVRALHGEDLPDDVAVVVVGLPDPGEAPR